MRVVLASVLGSSGGISVGSNHAIQRNGHGELMQYQPCRQIQLLAAT